MTLKVMIERRKLTKAERAQRIKVCGEKNAANLTLTLPMVNQDDPQNNASPEDLNRKSKQHLTKLKTEGENRALRVADSMAKKGGDNPDTNKPLKNQETKLKSIQKDSLSRFKKRMQPWMLRIMARDNASKK